MTRLPLLVLHPMTCFKDVLLQNGPLLTCITGGRQQEARWVGRSVQDRPWGKTTQGCGLQLCRCQGKIFRPLHFVAITGYFGLAVTLREFGDWFFFMWSPSSGFVNRSASQVQVLCLVPCSCLTPGKIMAMVRAPSSTCDIWGPYDWLHIVSNDREFRFMLLNI